MIVYDLVLDGEVIRESGLAVELDGAPPVLAPHKGEWLPREEHRPEVDLTYQRLAGPTREVLEDRVVYTWTVEEVPAEEFEPLREAKLQQLESEYRRRNALPFEAAVDGVLRPWHGDDEGMTNVRDVLMGIQLGVVPDPRPWKPYELPVTQVSHDGFRQIMMGYTNRKDSNFAVLQLKKAQVRAMTVVELLAFDPTAW